MRSMVSAKVAYGSHGARFRFLAPCGIMRLCSPGCDIVSGLFRWVSKWNWLGETTLLGLTLADLVARVVALVIAFSIHEFAHAWTALRLGDSTARHMGRLTLNPRAHLDVMGSIMVLVAGFGWAKPVPVNPRNLRYGPTTGMAIVAGAGPFRATPSQAWRRRHMHRWWSGWRDVIGAGVRR